MNEYDSPWKELVEEFFEPFMAFFFSEAHADIDWTEDPKGLDTELPRMDPDSEAGKRLADKLVRVKVKGEYVVVHIEIQGKPDELFDARVNVYNYRGCDRHLTDVVSLAILADGDAGWNPTGYVFARWGFKKSLEVPAVKVLTWAGREAELLACPNTVALFVAAHVAALTAEYGDDERAEAKVRILSALMDRAATFDGDDGRRWFRLIDWVLSVTPEQAAEVRKALKERVGRVMPYVTSFERLAREEGLAEGKLEGKLEGELQRAIRSLLRLSAARFGPGVLTDADLAGIDANGIDALEREALSTLAAPVEEARASFDRLLAALRAAATSSPA